MTTNPEPPNLDLGGRVRAWWDADAQRIVFYDFDNDEGFSLSVDEWQRTVAWAAQVEFSQLAQVQLKKY